MHRKLHSADHTFWFCGPLKFSKSDTCINLMRSSTRHHWKARLPNPDRTYHFSIWLTASAASLSFLLSSEFNRKFSFPHVQHLTAHGLWKLDRQVINVLKLVLQHVLFFFNLDCIFKFLMMLFCFIVYCFEAFNSRILRPDSGSRVFLLLKKMKPNQK